MVGRGIVPSPPPFRVAVAFDSWIHTSSAADHLKRSGASSVHVGGFSFGSASPLRRASPRSRSLIVPGLGLRSRGLGLTFRIDEFEVSGYVSVSQDGPSAPPAPVAQVESDRSAGRLRVARLAGRPRVSTRSTVSQPAVGRECEGFPADF